MRCGWGEQGEESWGLSQRRGPQMDLAYCLLFRNKSFNIPPKSTSLACFGVNPAVFRGYSKFSNFFVCLFVPPLQY